MYTKHFNTRKTPQSESIPGKEMVENSAGGYVFQLDKWKKLERFLILGSEGGTYYSSEGTLTILNANNIIDCAKEDPVRSVGMITRISMSGRAPKNDPALFALAVVASFSSSEGRTLALQELSSVARTGTHLLHFARYIDDLRGWGRAVRRGISRWYSNKYDEGKLVYTMLKYQSRDGWSQKDVLSLAHPRPVSEEMNSLFRWLMGKEVKPCSLPLLVQAYEQAKTADKEQLLSLIEGYGLTREMIPTKWLSDPDVLGYLFREMPVTATLRNLANLSRAGLLVEGQWDMLDTLKERFSRDSLHKARVHPIHVLAALHTYSRGIGFRSANTWKPWRKVIDLLDTAFYDSFSATQTTGQRVLIGLDVSGSMRSITPYAGLSAAAVSGAMSLVTERTEPKTTMFAFSDHFVPITAGETSLDEWMRYLRQMSFGGTDCALPMLYALKNKIPVDVFQVWTDNETWYGEMHPAQALRMYRDVMGIDAKLIVAGVTAVNFTIADPSDGGMMDVVGFDSNVPSLMQDFMVNRI